MRMSSVLGAVVLLGAMVVTAVSGQSVHPADWTLDRAAAPGASAPASAARARAAAARVRRQAP